MTWRALAACRVAIPGDIVAQTTPSALGGRSRRRHDRGWSTVSESPLGNPPSPSPRIFAAPSSARKRRGQAASPSEAGRWEARTAHPSLRRIIAKHRRQVNRGIQLLATTDAPRPHRGALRRGARRGRAALGLQPHRPDFLHSEPCIPRPRSGALIIEACHTPEAPLPRESRVHAVWCYLASRFTAGSAQRHPRPAARFNGLPASRASQGRFDIAISLPHRTRSVARAILNADEAQPRRDGMETCPR